MITKALKTLFLLLLLATTFASQAQQTYAEKLGWPKGAKVVIFHVDDPGMSYSSNQGTIKSVEQGIATSCSIMFPCSWSASFVNYIQKSNPNLDAGVHLTLTSEWRDYRWGPVAGFQNVPSLVDKEGNLWHEVAQVVKNGTADDVEKEIRAQVEKALRMGLKPTHIDSHMGTLFAHIPFMERYIKVGVEYGIPVMFPGGNNKLLIECQQYPIIKRMKAEGKWQEGMKLPEPELTKMSGAVGQKIWQSGLPVLDDLHTISGDWKPEKPNPTPEEWGRYKAQKFIETLNNMQPGLAMFIVHSSDVTDAFKHISASGGSRYADMLSMMNPELKAYIQSQGIILTTWREVMERRKKVK
ncbi:polysaccharide deacetylase family protein [Runella slithyformis]|uniref:YdjC family protein n=1 Tax=Runella slithyformis (strain ATCC 29530 / DSM 19594 / LMG 11500 / NCIMB 11436 / LSU 4) TaxID=761193 RepID=A0A7U3ZFY2_RUNSL|nr:ChbG/HpnK family deacetylase [Runella slithyformis]AEI46497.1 YdjC family protein [Runella slithyformis DSM 19594]